MMADYIGGDKIGGDKIGGDKIQVAGNMLQIGDVRGGVVYVAAPGSSSAPRLRPTPLLIRPRPFRRLIGRQAEIEQIVEDVETAVPIQLYARSGSGKTVLLRHLAYNLPHDDFPHGLIYLSARGQHLDDLSQSLFNAFYESEIPTKPTDADLRRAFQNIEALILLDDVRLDREALDNLLNIAPLCVFVFSSPDQQLWGEGSAIALGGLTAENTILLLERQLKRLLTPAEETAIATLNGHPLSLIQLASTGDLLAAIAGEKTAVSPDSLPEEERKTAWALAAFAGVPIAPAHLNAIGNLKAGSTAMDSLQAKGLVTAQANGHVSLHESIAQAWSGLSPVTDMQAKAVAHFSNIAQQHTPADLLPDLPAIQQLLAGDLLPEARLILTQAVESAFALSGLWGAWEVVLQQALQAAQTLGNEAAVAWVQHQLGTRSLCLGAMDEARNLLTAAAQGREAFGDTTAAALSRQNLNLLPPAGGMGITAVKSVPVAAKWIGGVMLILLLFAGGIFLRGRDGELPMVVPVTETAVSPTTTPTATATTTNTPKPTATSTATTRPTRQPLMIVTVPPLSTKVRPTATFTPLPTFTPSATSTPSPTFTPTPTPTSPPLNQAPNVTITAPNKDTFVTVTTDGIGSYAEVTFSASATDVEDGTPTVTWRTDRGDLQTAVLGQGSTITVRLYASGDCTTTHLITVTAVDSQGLTATQTMTIYIIIAC